MPLSYDPQHAHGWLPKPGVYPFEVLACEETTFRTGAHGIRVQLSVDAGGRTPMKFWTNIVFGEKSTWKMAELCRCVGVRFDPPCEATDLVGKTGRAEFDVREYEGLLGLEVVRYLVTPVR